MTTTALVFDGQIRQRSAKTRASDAAGPMVRSARLVAPDALAQVDFAAYRAEAHRMRSQALKEALAACAGWLRNRRAG